MEPVERLMDALGELYTGSEFKPLYTATVSITGGSQGHGRISGHACSPDGNFNLPLSLPKELGGPGGVGTNPEQLFAAGYASCFHGAIALIGRQLGIDTTNTTVTCAVTIGRDSVDGGYKLAAHLNVNIPNISREQAEQVLTQAHQVCPYSKAIRGNIDVAVKSV